MSKANTESKSREGENIPLAGIENKDAESADPATNADGQFGANSSLLNKPGNVDVRNMTEGSDNRPDLPEESKKWWQKPSFWIAAVLIVLAFLGLIALSIGLQLYVQQKNIPPVGNVLVADGPRGEQLAGTETTTYEPRPPSTTTHRALPRTTAKTVPPPRRYAPGWQRAGPVPPSDSPFDIKGKPTEPPTMTKAGGTIDTSERETVKDATTMGNSTEVTTVADEGMTTAAMIKGPY